MRRTIVLLLLLAAALPLFATDPNPSARQRELIDRLLTQIGVGRATKSMLDAMYAQMEKQFTEPAGAEGAQSEGYAEGKEMFASFREKVAKVDFDALMRDAYVRIYAKYFTESELADMVAFYDTPTGQKAIEMMPQLMAEGAQAGVQNLSPKIEEIIRQVSAEQEKKRPWRKTMSDIRGVAAAVEAYAVDNDDKYPAGDYASLKAVLEPQYIKKLPEKDMWDHEYAYVVSGDGAHYRIVSAGADTNFEWDSRRIVVTKDDEPPAVQYRERLEDDLIYADGQFIQLPAASKPKAK